MAWHSVARVRRRDQIRFAVLKLLADAVVADLPPRCCIAYRRRRFCAVGFCTSKMSYQRHGAARMYRFPNRLASLAQTSRSVLDGAATWNFARKIVDLRRTA